MAIKVSITDLQTRIMYHGSLKSLNIVQGKELLFDVDNKPGYAYRIGKVRGWLVSDSNLLWYLISGSGKRYKVRIIDTKALDSKQ